MLLRVITLLIATGVGVSAQVPKAAKKATAVNPSAGKTTASVPGTAGTPKFKAIWEPVNFNKDLRLRDIVCFGPEECLVVGAKGTILYTATGGKTWEARLGGDPESTDVEIEDLSFLDESNGWALDDHGLVFQTTDKGATWTQAGKATPTTTRLAFFNPMSGVGQDNTQRMVLTKDGGKQWTPGLPCVIEATVEGLARKMDCHFTYLASAGPSTAYAGAEVGIGTDRIGVIFKTGDGGQSWTGSVPTTFDDGVRKMYFWSPTHGISLLFSSKTMLTTDGGETWIGVISPLKYNSYYASGDGKFVVGVTENNRQAVYSTNGGRTFTSRPLPAPAPIRALAFPDATHGYFVGDHGMIFRYRIVPIDYSVPGMIAALAP